MWHTLQDIRRDRLAFTMRLAREYGDLVRFRMGWRENLLVNDPGLIRQVLVEHPEHYRKGLGLQHARALFGDGLLTSEGATWRMQRTITAQAFRHETVEGLVPEMAKVIDAELDTWSAVASQGQPVDIRHVLSRLTLRVLGRVLLGQELGPQSGVLTHGVTVALDHAMRSMSRFLDSPLRSAPRALYGYRQALRDFHAGVDHIIHDMRGNPATESAPLYHVLSAHRNYEADTGTLHDEVATLLIVGHETTAAAACWAFLLLARHPDIEASVRAEIEAARAAGDITWAGLARLGYTRAVVEETLRLYPPVWLIPREAIVEHELGGVPVRLKTGVLVSPYVLHRHPAFWAEPERFRPERFLARKANGRAPGAYMPFGLGPRACMGAMFATAELMLILRQTMQRFRVRFDEDGGAIVPEALLTLRPAGETRAFLGAIPAPGPIGVRPSLAI